MSDGKFENYLREFAPKPLRPLPASRDSSENWRRLAAAAALALVCGTSLWVASREGQAPRSPQTGNEVSPGELPSAWQSRMALTNRALQEPETFEAALRKEGQKHLPSFSRPDSTLRVLARE